MTNPTPPRRIILGVTGASGAAYAHRLLTCLLDRGIELHLIFSAWGRKLFSDELAITDLSPASLFPEHGDRLIVHSDKALDSPLASGSFLTDGMIICPCTSHTLGQIAAGLADSLLTRAAAVTLKEARRLIVVPREMPTSRIDLENMLRLSSAGAIVCPANPGFYMNPKTIDDLVNFVVGKLLDLMRVSHAMDTRWSPSVARRPVG